jgi:mono/diheme cytochrome c family protein
MRARWALAAVWLAGCTRPAAPADDGAPLRFVRDGRDVKTLDRDALVRAVAPEQFEAYDPYYSQKKRFRALPLRAVLKAGFGQDDASVHYVLRARDGYTVPMSGKRLLEDGAYLAIADLDAPGWQPIGPQQANPGPYYLVWRNPSQQDLESHPRPWQLAAIEIAPFAAVFPHTEPGREAPDSARRGQATFADVCVRCHAINREGGRVGPELNVPRSIVEYRPVEQIKAYIRDPRQFRYGNMPPHPGLTDADLDDLIAYFQAMSARKHDPGSP